MKPTTATAHRFNSGENTSNPPQLTVTYQVPTLANISTRLRVETGDNVLIGGFIVTGTQPKRIIVRAIGPSLPLAGVLADPILELRDGSGGLILSNDNWRIGGQEAEIIATGIPPTNDLESAIVATLPANNSAYTAIMRGVNNGTGIGVVEAVRSGSNGRFEAGEHFHARLGADRRQRLDRRIDCARAKPAAGDRACDRPVVAGAGSAGKSDAGTARRRWRPGRLQ